MLIRGEIIEPNPKISGGCPGRGYVSVRMMGVSKNKKLGNYCQTKVVLSPNRSKINTIQRVFF